MPPRSSVSRIKRSYSTASRVRSASSAVSTIVSSASSSRPPSSSASCRLSIVSATVALPFVLARLKLPPQAPLDAEEDAARKVAGKAATRAIERLKDELAGDHDDDELFAKAADRAMERYSRRELVSKTGGDLQRRNMRLADIERRLRLAALRAERQTFYRLRRERKLDDVMLRRLVQEVDLLETRFSQ